MYIKWFINSLTTWPIMIKISEITHKDTRKVLRLVWTMSDRWHWTNLEN